MIDILARFFIDRYKNTEDPNVQSKYISLSGILGLFLNILLFISKLAVGSLTNSIALISDSFNNLSDSLTSVVAVLGSAASRKPADSEHPHGHGRIEYIASLIVGILIMFMGVQLLSEGVNELRNPTETNMSIAFIGVLILSNLVKVYMYMYNKNLAVRFNSPLNQGVAMDSLNDTIATTGILIGGLISYFTDFKLDGIMGIIIALLVFKTGLEFALSTTSTLLGEQISKETEDGIVKEIMSGKYVKGYHDLYFHDYGRGNVTAHVHIEVPTDISVGEMHGVIDSIEKNVKRKYNILLVTHMDPSYELADIEESKETKVIDMGDVENTEEIIEEAADLIRAGDLVVVPTETVYGLAGDGLNPEAIRKIFEAKERDSKNPLILHIANKKDMENLAVDIPKLAYKLADKFWPGPLTIVLKKSDIVPDAVTAGTDTVAIRMPDNEIILKLIEKSERPLACPSANLSGRPSPTTVVDVYSDMKGKVKLILGQGSTRLGLESTIVDLTQKPTILRLGYYDIEEIRDIIPEISYSEDSSSTYKNAVEKPHYKTRADIIVYKDDLPEQVSRINEDIKKYQKQGLKVGVLSSNEDRKLFEPDEILSYGSKNDKDEIARVLFAKLRDLDRLGVDLILVQGVDEKGIGKTIMSRFIKAADGNIVSK